MSRKSSRIGKSSGQAKGKQIVVQSVNEEKARAERRLSRRAFLVLGLMILTVSGFGAVASWRTLATTASTKSAANPPLVTGTPPAMPASAPAKEFIYAGSALLATSESFRQTANDIAVWRPSGGGGVSTWYILNAQQQINSFQFGYAEDKPLTRDFDGDGKTDFCVYRRSAAQWHIIRSSDSTYYVVNFGTANDDLPAPSDYDGDGRADIAVFRPSTNYWHIRHSSDNALISVFFGATDDVPESADFDGDGKADLAAWRGSEAKFYVRKSTDSLIDAYSIGANGDQPVIGDYDGDGKADYAVRRPSDGIWRIRRSSDGSLFSVQWGIASDKAVQGNYSDGDAKTDIAVWRPSNGMWYIRKSTDETMRAVHFGQEGDTPVPAPYRR